MADDAADAVAGLGNFKGVMLCNRPDVGDERLKDPTKLKPFYSSVAPGALEPLGMLHPTSLDPLAQRKDEVPALRKHRDWLKRLHVWLIILDGPLIQNRELRFPKVPHQRG